ncbi:MAG: hypothetical protein WDZ83_15125 [Rhizobiaceae bacterium]
MNNLARTLVLSASAAAVVLSAVPMAEAGGRHSGHRYPWVDRHHDRTGTGAGIRLSVDTIVFDAQIESGVDHSDPGLNPFRKPRPSPDRNFLPPIHAAHFETAGDSRLAWLSFCQAPYRIVYHDGPDNRACVSEQIFQALSRLAATPAAPSDEKRIGAALVAEPAAGPMAADKADIVAERQ